MVHTTDSRMGVNLALVSPDKTFELGTVVHGTDNTVWLYVQASGAVATGTCTVDNNTFLVTDVAGEYTCDVAIPDGQFGWVRQTSQAIGNPDAVGLSNVVEDLTPQLGGDLDLNGSDIIAQTVDGPQINDVGASATVPTFLPRRDGFGATSGIGASAAGEVSIINQASESIRVSNLLITANRDIDFGNAAGPSILNEAASATNPTIIPNKTDDATGLGYSAGNNRLEFISNGINIATISMDGNMQFHVASSLVRGEMSSSWGLENVAASGTVPTLLPRNASNSTGIGASSGNAITFITSGANRFEIDSTGAWILTASAGTAGDVLTSNGAGVEPTWQAAGGLANVVEDLSPQLGGNLDMNSNDIIAATAGGPDMIDVAATTTVPTFRPTGAVGTGIGGTGDEMELIADSQRVITIGSAPSITFRAVANASAVGSWQLANSAASATVPTLIPDSGSATTGIGQAGTNEVSLISNAVEVGRFDDSAVATETRFMVYDVDNATLERVTVGAADSGGVGFKVLRIPN